MAGLMSVEGRTVEVMGQNWVELRGRDELDAEYRAARADQGDLWADAVTRALAWVLGDQAETPITRRVIAPTPNAVASEAAAASAEVQEVAGERRNEAVAVEHLLMWSYHRIPDSPMGTT